MGSSSDWSPVVEALQEEAYTVTVDLPGHGRSHGRPPHLYTMEGVAQALADVFDEAGIDRCALVGYSMGGRVALYFSVFQSERVRRLVLESASPGLRSDNQRSRRRDVDERRALQIQKDLSGFLEEWYRQPLFSSLERHDLVQEMIDRREENDPDELARVLRGMGPGNQTSLWERLPDLDVPTMMLTGALDEKYVDITKKAAEMAGCIDRVVVPRAGHNVHAERSQAFVAQLVQFLQRT